MIARFFAGAAAIMARPTVVRTVCSTGKQLLAKQSVKQAVAPVARNIRRQLSPIPLPRSSGIRTAYSTGKQLLANQSFKQALEPVAPFVNHNLQRQLSPDVMFGTTKRCVVTCTNICNRCLDDDEIKRRRDFVLKQKKQAIDLSLWTFPADCCKRECPDLPRFDELYWQPSDKGRRRYQQTWCDCKIICKPKVVCSVKDCCPPPKEKRRRCPPEYACSYDNAKFLMICKNMGKNRCPRLTMPCCKEARYPPTCVKKRVIGDCTKIKCPYPSFSECLAPHGKKLRAIECKCRDNISDCEFLRIKRKLSLRRQY